MTSPTVAAARRHATGAPCVGGRSMANTGTVTNSIGLVNLGPYNNVAPAAVNTDTSTPSFLSYDASLSESTVLASNTYIYWITPYDFHGNAGPSG